MHRFTGRKILSPVISMVRRLRPRLRRDAIDDIANWLNATLATDFAVNIDRWMREAFATGPSSIYDRAMDAARETSGELGGDHRLFDGGHDLFGAWDAVHEALPDDSFSTEFAGYLSAIGKDVVTPMGLPLKTLDRDHFETLAAGANALGISTPWLKDALSFTATEGIGAAVGGLALMLHWKESDIEKFSTIVASLGLSALIGANPLMGLVALVAAAHAFQRARSKGEYWRLAKGTAKGGFGMAAFLAAASIVSGPIWVALVLGVLASILAQKAFEAGVENAEAVDWAEVARFAARLLSRQFESGERWGR